MTERIDHAAEARELLENYAPDYMVAQVHATLALVEQQRIANLIAISQFNHVADDQTRIYTDLEAAIAWRNEAAEALGLGDQT
jgi:hypothetical protein